MIYWSTRKKALVFFYENQPKVWLTKEGWQSDSAPSELIEEYKLMVNEVYHYSLPKFSYSLIKKEVRTILKPYLNRFKESDLGEKLMLAAYICNEGKDICIKELSLNSPEAALCLFFYKKENWRLFTANLL